MKKTRIYAASLSDYENGLKAGTEHFTTYEQDIDQIKAEEERTKDIKKDALEKRKNDLDEDIKQLNNELSSYQKSWEKVEKDIGAPITIGDIEQSLIKLHGFLIKIAILLGAEIIFTASMMMYALGISRFKATFFAIAYPSLSSFILKTIFHNFEKKNYFYAVFFIILQIIFLFVLGAFAYLNANAEASAIQDININVLRGAFIGLVTVLSLFLGYYYYEREKIVYKFKPLIKILKKQKIAEDKLNNLVTDRNDVADQLKGLDEEYEKIKNLRIESYQAGFRNGIIPIQKKFTDRLLVLETELQKIMARINGLKEEFDSIKSARIATYNAGYQEGAAIRARRIKLLNFFFHKNKN